jgi:hypothetical protein
MLRFVLFSFVAVAALNSASQAQHGFLDPTAERPVPVALDWGMSPAEVDSALLAHYGPDVVARFDDRKWLDTGLYIFKGLTFEFYDYGDVVFLLLMYDNVGGGPNGPAYELVRATYTYVDPNPDRREDPVAAADLFERMFGAAQAGAPESYLHGAFVGSTTVVPGRSCDDYYRLDPQAVVGQLVKVKLRGCSVRLYVRAWADPSYRW